MDHLGDFGDLFFYGQKIDKIKGIIKKMGVDLGTEQGVLCLFDLSPQLKLFFQKGVDFVD